MLPSRGSYFFSYSSLAALLTPGLDAPTVDGRSAPIGLPAGLPEDDDVWHSLHPSPMPPTCIWSLLANALRGLRPWCGSVELLMWIETACGPAHDEQWRGRCTMMLLFLPPRHSLGRIFDALREMVFQGGYLARMHSLPLMLGRRRAKCVCTSTTSRTMA